MTLVAKLCFISFIATPLLFSNQLFNSASSISALLSLVNILAFIAHLFFLCYCMLDKHGFLAGRVYGNGACVSTGNQNPPPNLHANIGRGFWCTLVTSKVLDVSKLSLRNPAIERGRQGETTEAYEQYAARRGDRRQSRWQRDR